MIQENKLYNENCLDTMRRMPSDYVDLVVTSPPYDGLREYNGYSFDFEAIATELYRIMKPGGVVVWVVGDGTEAGSESCTSFRQALYFRELGFLLHDTMIFEKHNFASPSSTRYHQIFEYMFVFSKGKPSVFNPIRDKKNKYAGSGTFGKNTRRQADGTMKEMKKNVIADMGIRTNIWRYIVGNMNGDDACALEHPAIFPEQLAADHIHTWSNPGDLVYEPFGGSGTTPKMAHIMGRRWIASEMSAEYCELITRRMYPHLSQQRLIL